MEDIADKKKHVLEIAELINSHKGLDTIALYVGKECSWSDFFIITTANSTSHMEGLLKHIKDYMENNEMPGFNNRGSLKSEKWRILDYGSIIIHLMSREARGFYELEQLWFSGETIHQSSKSS